MTVVRLGYVAMSVQLSNCSPSQTMTYTQFQKMGDREAAVRRLERIARSNLDNCLRLLKHNAALDIRLFRFSSRLVPLATHPDLAGWDYMAAIAEPLGAIAAFLERQPMRVDFHPDHFVLLNAPDSDIFRMSVKTLRMHEKLLRGVGVDPAHRCVLHVGGGYGDKERALERFIERWSDLPADLQRMILLENDDTTFTLRDTLLLCEKLGVPLVFDLHHHLACHEQPDWTAEWERVVATWRHSPLPVKMHISSPRDERNFRAHHDFVDPDMFMDFLREIKGTVSQIDCMIEAKQKDAALLRLMEELKRYPEAERIDGASFHLRLNGKPPTKRR